MTTLCVLTMILCIAMLAGYGAAALINWLERGEEVEDLDVLRGK